MPIQELPPYFTNSTQDRAGVLMSGLLVLICYSALSFLIRIQVKWQRRQKAGPDDYTCLAALIFGLVVTAVAHRSVIEGFGKRLDIMTEAAIRKVETLQIISLLLAIVSITLGKVSIVAFQVLLTPRKDQKRMSYILIGFIASWCVAAIVSVAATSCNMLQAWDTENQQCTSFQTTWSAVVTFDILTEAAMLANAMYIIWDLQMNWRKKSPIAFIFGVRAISVTIPAALHRVYLGPFITSSDPLDVVVVPFMMIQLEVHLGIITATITALVSWLRSFRPLWGAAPNAQSSNSYPLDKNGGSSSRRTRTRTTEQQAIPLSNLSRSGGMMKSKIRAERAPSQDSQHSQVNFIRKQIEIQWQESSGRGHFD